MSINTVCILNLILIVLGLEVWIFRISSRFYSIWKLCTGNVFLLRVQFLNWKINCAANQQIKPWIIIGNAQIINLINITWLKLISAMRIFGLVRINFMELLRGKRVSVVNFYNSSKIVRVCRELRAFMNPEFINAQCARYLISRHGMNKRECGGGLLTDWRDFGDDEEGRIISVSLTLTDKPHKCALFSTLQFRPAD